MPVMFQRDGKPVWVPEKDVAQRVLAGEVAFMKKDRIPVRSPKGDFGWVPGGNLARAFRAGYTFDMAGARAEIAPDWRKGYETPSRGHQLTAAALGISAGATFGLWPTVTSKIGGKEFKEKSQLIRETFPKTTLGFDILGSLIGLGKLKVGTKVAAGVAKKLAPAIEVGKRATARQIVARAAGRTVGAAVEGGMVGGGAALTDIALGDVDNAAEHFVGSVGMGALYGGGISVGLQIPGLGVHGVKAGVGALWQRATSERMQKWTLEKISKMVQHLSDADPKTVEDFFVGPASVEFRRLATETGEVLDKLGMRGAQIEDEMEAVGKLIQQEAVGTLKIDRLAALLKGKPIQPAAEEVYAIINQGAERVDDLGKLVPKGKLRRPVRELRQVLVQLREDVEKAVRQKDIVKLFDAADKVKNVLQSRTPWVQFSYKALPQEAREALTKVQKIGKMLREHLGDPKYYGKGALMQKEVNSWWTRFYSRMKYKGASKFHTLEEMEKGYLRRYKANPSAFKRFVQQAPSQARTDADMRFLMDMHEIRLGLNRSIVKWYKNPVLEEAMPKLALTRKSFARWISAVEESAVARRQWKNLEAAHSPLAGVLDVARKVAYFGTFGSVAGGYVPPALGSAALLGGVKIVESLAKPTKILRTIAAIERRRVQNNTRIGDVSRALQRLSDKGEKAVLKKAVPTATVLTVLSTMLPSKRGRPKKERAAPLTSSLYKKRFQQLAQLQVDPQRLGEALWQKPERLEEVPLPFMVASQAQLHRTVDYLVATAPKPRVGLMSENWEPDPGELRTWTERVQASNNPVSVLEAAYKGEVSNAQVETVATLYPQVYNEMRQAVLEAVGLDGWSKLPYYTRVAFSLFMGMPTDPSLHPDFVMSLQELYASEPERPQSVAALPPRDRMGRFTRGQASKRAETTVERIS